MKSHLLPVLVVVIGWAVHCFGQDDFRVSYRDLKQYEGNYEYLNGTRLQLAASPKDNILFAVIDEGRYPLKAVKRDFFLDGQNSQVIFERDKSDKITGYRIISKESNQFFRFLSGEMFPEEMWYPRRPVGNRKFKYQYSRPKNLNDGLKRGLLANTGLDIAAVTEMVNRIADETYKNVHSVLIVKDGKLVLEEYFYEYDQGKLHQLRSATKSFVSALIGIAIDQGVIKSKDETVLSFFPEYDVKNNSEDKRKITIENLLTNESGLECDDYNENSPGNELKMGESTDWVKFILDLPMADKPGSKGRYCSGGVIVLGRIIEKATGKSINDFASRNLFKPLGISDFKWNFKPDKSSAASFCQIYLTPRSMAKFGLLYLNGGKYNGRQILSRSWVEASLSKHSVVDDTDYGYLWWREWLNVNGKRVDGVTAKGNGGQRIFLWPELNMAAVITGGNYNVQSSSNQLLIKYILPSFIK